MRILNKSLIATCFMCLFFYNVQADTCSKDVSSYLTKEAYYVKTTYEVIDQSTYKEITVGENKTTFKIPKYEFNISIFNITKNLYIVIESDKSDAITTVHYSDTENGTYNFIDQEFGEIYKYVITIYSDDGDCLNKKLKTLKLVRPMYNAYSEYSYCKNSSNYYCQKFTKTDLKLKGNDDFLSKIKVNNDKRNTEVKKEKKERESTYNMIMNNWQMYIGIFISSIFISLILVAAIRKRQAKKEWE